MKHYRASKGPFAERPVYSKQEIEDLCAGELKKAGLLPTAPEPVRIERFIEKRFGTSPDYEELPEGLLGFTKFGKNGVEKIVVARSLADDSNKVASRRINTTLAHEAGHGLLHAHLFALGSEAASLFDGQVDPAAPKILCRPDGLPSDEKRPAYDGRWWEYQANLCIGALLLPRPLVEQCLAPVLTTAGTFGVKTLEAKNRKVAMKLVSDVFDVNPIVAKIRMEQMFPEKDIHQLTL
jgi:hypothetical protein